MAIAPVQVGPDTPSESPVSQSRRRGRDLETVIYITRVIKLQHSDQIMLLKTPSWKHLPFVQSGILDKPDEKLRVARI